MGFRPTVALYDPHRPAWLSFRRPAVVIRAHEPGAVRAALREVERAVATHGYTAAGFVAYEAAPAFDPALSVRGRPDVPLVWFGLFDDAEIAPELLAPDRDERPVNWTPSTEWPTYQRAVEDVQTHIARGDTYQVNYTMRLRANFNGNPWTFFRSLVSGQTAPYAAYVETDRHALCSASPELFFEMDAATLRSKPMKGTAARGEAAAEDQLNAEWLQHSVKNRAENAMIVDMIRNDMGKIAEVGSVRVPHLFEIESYPTVLQMTSTVESQTDASFEAILEALFPCASITGAPKARTMELISQMEADPRGVYTGAIGYLAPGRRAQFNVAIRTPVVDLVDGRAEYGVGGGIVWDSDPAEEYEECRIKARVLAGATNTRAESSDESGAVRTSPSGLPR